MSRLLVICFLCLALPDCGKEKKTAKKPEPPREVVVANFRADLDDLELPRLQPADTLKSDDVTAWVDSHLPKLGEKWTQIRTEHNKCMQVLILMEYKRAQLLAITSLEDSNIGLDSAPQYLKILARLRSNAEALRRQNEKIRESAEMFYAEDAADSVWSDREMKEHVDSLIHSADIILEATRTQTDLQMQADRQ